MVMSWIWTGLVAMAVVASLVLGTGAEVSKAALEGAQKGVTLAISMGGAICLWTGVGKVMEKAGITNFLTRLLRPLLRQKLN